MVRTTVVSLLAIAIGTAGNLGAAGPMGPEQGDTEVTQRTKSAETRPALNDLKIQIVQDNYPYLDQLETAWGFAAYVSGPNTCVLFDTGSDGDLLLGNMAKLSIDPNLIDTVVLSHRHGDHTGGLVTFLKRQADVTLYCPKSFPDQFKEVIRGYGTRLVEIGKAQSIGDNLYSTGQMGIRIPEQALVVRTVRGLVVITGCAHPGVVRMVEKVRSLHDEEILLVLGGFHLTWAPPGEIEQVINALAEQGVRYVAPTHCSGDKARTLFHERFGTRYLEVGAGSTITLTDLK